MAQFFKAKRNVKTQTAVFNNIAVDVIDHQGNGICLSHKPIIVVPGAIAGEQYRVEIHTKKKRAWYGTITKVLKANEAARVPTFCPYVSQCGGCSHQSFDANFLINAKLASLQTYLKKQIEPAKLAISEWEDVIKSNVIDSRRVLATTPTGQGTHSKVSPNELGPSEQSQFGYRRRARIAIDARNPEAIKVGFRQEKSNKIVDIKQCAILSSNLQTIYASSALVVKRLPSASSIGHITLTEGTNAVQVCLHLTHSLCEASINMLRADALANKQQNLNVKYSIETKAGKLISLEYLQSISAAGISNNNSAASSIVNQDEKLIICDIDDLQLAVAPNNFIQVNQSVNQLMLQCAIEWLAPTKQDVVVDLFSGVGNFGLALAHYCAEVIGVEGVPEMVQVANENAQLNGIKNCRFEHFDLNDLSLLAKLKIPKNAIFIVDPSRAGALEIMKTLPQFGPQKILYVSCSPTSFARDIDALPCNYQITKIRALDMFPFTKHIEIIALISSN
ncbi:MAG: 23S rRNA (uracil1939-C5)-methyltransferase [Glaciecola sp.]